MVDQGLEVLAAALAFWRVEDQALETRFLEIVVERRVILEIDLGTPAGDLVERRLGDEEVPVLDQLRHLPIEKGQQQRADVCAVNVGVRHDHDLVVAQLFEVKFLVTDRRAERLNQRPDFLRAEHPIEAGALDV